MLVMMVLAHVLGDYVLQFDALARWKSRSALGVAVHGLLVTSVTLACAVVVVRDWWPYALLIGVMHALVDLVRAQLIVVTRPMLELLWFLADQCVHLITIVAVVFVSGAYQHLIAAPGIDVILTVLILLQPTWVLLRFVVRAFWGAAAAPPLGAGDKVAPMLERLSIAGLAFAGYGYFAPLILLPRRLAQLHRDDGVVIIHLTETTHWAETLLGMALALTLGSLLRVWLLSP